MVSNFSRARQGDDEGVVASDPGDDLYVKMLEHVTVSASGQINIVDYEMKVECR
jgi:hypothetical protein